MTRAVERGAEHFLSKALHRQGARYEPRFRLHDPVHYYYDLLRRSLTGYLGTEGNRAQPPAIRES